MSDSWKVWERSAEKGPTGFILRIVFAITLIVVVVGGLSYALGWCGEAAQVAQEEFGARGSLKKYEWFKEAAQQLKKKDKDISIAEQKLKTLEEAYTGIARGQWPRSDREQYNVWASELSGIKSSYNNLVAEYNAASSKFNWSHVKSEGDLPPQHFVEK